MSEKVLKGWIFTVFKDETGARLELEKIGVKLGPVKKGSEVKLRGGVEFEDCEVSEKVMEELDGLWGTYVWGLTDLPETPDDEDEETVSPGKIIDFHHKIWLQTDDPLGQEVKFSDLSDVSWAPDQIDEWDIPYVSEEAHLAIVRRLQRMLSHRYKVIKGLEDDVRSLMDDVDKAKEQIPKPEVLEEIRDRVIGGHDLIWELRQAISEMGIQLHGFHSNVGKARQKEEWSRCHYRYCKRWYDLAYPEQEVVVRHPQEVRVGNNGDIQNPLPGLEEKINPESSKPFIEKIEVKGDHPFNKPFIVMTVNIGGLKGHIILEPDNAFEIAFKLLTAHQQIKNQEERQR